MISLEVLSLLGCYCHDNQWLNLREAIARTDDRRKHRLSLRTGRQHTRCHLFVKGSFRHQHQLQRLSNQLPHPAHAPPFLLVQGGTGFVHLSLLVAVAVAVVLLMLLVMLFEKEEEVSPQ
jgi:hypothetical protein